MYKLIRNIHLVISLIITPFLFIYAISSIFFAHNFLNFLSDETTVEKFVLSSFSANPTELAKQLATTHGIQGDLKSSKVDKSGMIGLYISRPGKQYQIRLDTKSGTVTSEETTPSAFSFTKTLHTTAGFHSDDSGEWWWSVFALIVAVLLLLLLITGLILWTYRIKERKTGVIFLSVSLVYSISLLCVLRLGDGI